MVVEVGELAGVEWKEFARFEGGFEEGVFRDSDEEGFEKKGIGAISTRALLQLRECIQKV
jgi:hypothetical protein